MGGNSGESRRVEPVLVEGGSDGRGYVAVVVADVRVAWAVEKSEGVSPNLAEEAPAGKTIFTQEGEAEPCEVGDADSGIFKLGVDTDVEEVAKCGTRPEGEAGSSVYKVHCLETQGGLKAEGVDRGNADSISVGS